MTNELIHQDQQHRERALHAHESFIVQAPAGSGKTELIIQRFLTLLGHVKKPEEILAITFTKKSAHEMRARVLNALEQAATQPEPEKPHERLTWRLATHALKRDREYKWNLIDNPNQLHIKTIDSFCTYLTNQLPLLSHFGSQPDIANYAQSLYREAVYEVLSHVEENHPWSPAVARLLAHTDNDLNRLAKLLTKMLEKRDQWQRYLNLDRSGDELRALLTEQITEVVDYTLLSAHERLPEHHTEELLFLLRFSSDFQIVSLDEANFPCWQRIADMLLTKSNTWRKLVNDEIGFPTLGTLKGEELKINKAIRARHKELMNALQDDEGLRATLECIRKLPQPAYTDEQWDALQALLEVLKITLAQLRVTFQTYGQIDFIENAWGAGLALGDDTAPTDLALSLDYQIRHILVDEFQDTSSTQYHLLKMLTYGWQQDDGRSLFVVGDPMQSIYRFRQADVSLFLRLQQQGIGDIRLTPLTLAVNFRSTSQIVNWNNQQFKAIFPDYSDIGTGAVHFNPSIAHQIKEENAQPDISVQGFLDAGEYTQADTTIRLINETLAAWPNEKIAILVRSRSHLAAIVPALKAANLRYNAVEIDPLITRQCIQDLLALTRALIHPADRIAWLAVLRAPWCGLTLADLLKLTGAERHAIIWERMNHANVLASLSPEGQARLAAIKPALQAAILHRERSAFRQWVEQTWLALGGPATLVDYNEMADVDEYFDLLESLSSQSHGINLELLNERMNQLNASTHHEDAPIQIMTIHSAKGLEFDTVILPHLEKMLPNDDKSLLLWMEQPLPDDKISLLLAPIHAADGDADALYRYIENQQRAKAHFEVDRLLYVATTRAKKRLHLIFNVKDEEQSSQRGSFLDKLWPLIKNTTSLIKPATASIDTPMTTKPLRSLIRFSPHWSNPVTIQQPAGNVSQQTHSGFQLRDPSARLIGTIAHSIFQQLAISGTQWWLERCEKEWKAYMRQHFMRAGLSPTKYDEAANTLHTIIERALQDERCKWILHPHLAAQSEYQLTVTTAEGCENLIIDRTFIDTEGTRWIIDYKTAETQDNDLDAFFAKQKTKFAPQMAKYQEALRQFESRPIKMGLYFPALAAWCEYN
jgi:ATP-dependent exoDNAse (exonuclease V) beta subunit